MKRRGLAFLKVFFLFLFGCITPISLHAENETIFVPKPRSAFDLSHDYHLTLLKKALAETSAGNNLPTLISTVAMVESRAVKELEKGQILDIGWLGTDAEKEEYLLPIPIPTTQGLIGFRKFFVHREKQSVFNEIGSFDDLRKLIACQGRDWPDTLILRHAGLTVATTPHYEDIFAMLNAGRCDYFPRGIHDFKHELESRRAQYPELIAFDEIVLHYPFAVYFFTNKNNHALAERVQQGLKALHENGEFLAHMQSHPLTRHAFPLTQSKGTKVFTIKNLQFTESSLREKSLKYMFQLPDLGVNNTK